MSLICPKADCRQFVSTRDNKHYGVHFSKVTDINPCEMSCKPIEQKELNVPTTLDNRFRIGMIPGLLPVEEAIEELVNSLMERTGHHIVAEVVLSMEYGKRIGWHPGQAVTVATQGGDLRISIKDDLVTLRKDLDRESSFLNVGYTAFTPEDPRKTAELFGRMRSFINKISE